ncbi:hypothetical protein BB561_004820 [Smittium simulii]|uniref:C2H2-type domain-containing protein n=1 Tax=Smittium simulii TaxID=133385 RepID=A0A2T9YDY0_9FUNG|nr:hypothetical protein BB561_004820 [Smittium simulii]
MSNVKSLFSINFLVNKTDVAPSLLDFDTSILSSGSAEGSEEKVQLNSKYGVTCEWGDCSLVFANETQLTDHIINKHIGRGLSEYICLIRNCSRLRRPFQKRQKLLNHLRTHTGERPYPCKFRNCNKRFARLDSLKSHEKTHLCFRQYECPFKDCKKVFMHQKLLENHKQSHFEPNTIERSFGSAPISMGVSTSNSTMCTEPRQNIPACSTSSNCKSHFDIVYTHPYKPHFKKEPSSEIFNHHNRYQYYNGTKPLNFDISDKHYMNSKSISNVDRMFTM